MKSSISNLTPSQQQAVERHVAFHEARGNRPRWCASHGAGVALWVGDEPCIQCEQDRRKAAVQLPPIGAFDREMLAQGRIPCWLEDDPDLLAAYVLAGEVPSLAS